jgi:hypothetical protein
VIGIGCEDKENKTVEFGLNKDVEDLTIKIYNIEKRLALSV